MKLYYAPGTCSLAVHVALIWTGEPYEIIKVDQSSEAFKKINPMGAVPALEDGASGIMTQVDSLLTYIATKYPEKKLMGAEGIKGQQEFHQWLAFLSSDLHPAFGPIFSPQRYSIETDTISMNSVKAAANERLRKIIYILDNHLSEKDYIVNNELSYADPLAYIMTRWLGATNINVDEFPNLARHFKLLGKDPAIIQAEKEQGIRKKT